MLAAVDLLHQQKINHFDLKADNFLLADPPPAAAAATAAEVADGAPAAAPAAADQTLGSVRVVVADFGVSKNYVNEEEGYTTRDRGTEYIKAPEMLAVGRTAGSTQGGNRACDVWSVGCLLFELLTGEYLFQEDDWTTFYMRVTNEALPLVTPQKLELLPQEHAPALVSFLQFVLQRDVARRPTIGAVVQRFANLRAQLCPAGGVGAPTPRGAFGVSELGSPTPRAGGLTDRPTPTKTPQTPAAAAVAASPGAAAASPPGLRYELGAPLDWAEEWESPTVEARGACGAVPVGDAVLLAPRALLGRPHALRQLRVGEVVCCGVTPPPRAQAELPEARWTELPLPIDFTAADAAVAAAVARAAAAGRTVLLVGDAQLGGCATVAALHLARASGVSPSVTLLSLRNACPAALHHQVDLDALAALAF